MYQTERSKILETEAQRKVDGPELPKWMAKKTKNGLKFITVSGQSTIAQKSNIVPGNFDINDLPVWLKAVHFRTIVHFGPKSLLQQTWW